MGYNGWKNYETWNVPLWVDNDYGMYQARMELTKQTKGQMTDLDAARFVTDLMPNGTPDMDGPADYGKVDWQEVADAWNTEYEDA